ncbi:hypothetical protein [Streptomyces noursei]
MNGFPTSKPTPKLSAARNFPDGRRLPDDAGEAARAVHEGEETS